MYVRWRHKHVKLLDKILNKKQHMWTRTILFKNRLTLRIGCQLSTLCSSVCYGVHYVYICVLFKRRFYLNVKTKKNSKNNINTSSFTFLFFWKIIKITCDFQQTKKLLKEVFMVEAEISEERTNRNHFRCFTPICFILVFLSFFLLFHFVHLQICFSSYYTLICCFLCRHFTCASKFYGFLKTFETASMFHEIKLQQKKPTISMRSRARANVVVVIQSLFFPLLSLFFLLKSKWNTGCW